VKAAAFATVLCLVAANAHGQPAKQSTDSRLLGMALEDFARRSDTMSLHKDGIVLIEGETAPWTLEKVGYFSLGREGAKCPIGSGLYADVAARNSSRESAAPLVGPAAVKWRLLGKEEADLPKGRLFVDRTAGGEAIKTIAIVSKPGYSRGGDAALVLFQFTWSMHAAIAQYLMRREGADWKIECSELKFYP
jgi:hypothetical protein